MIRAISGQGLRHEWRSSEVRVLVYALIVAVASVTAVSFFIDRVERGMSLQSSELLAADLVVESSRPLRKELFIKAKEAGLQIAKVVDFPSVVLRGDETQLVQVKAVESGYPLRGTLQISDETRSGVQTVKAVPEAGTVWIDPVLGQRLSLTLQDNLSLGDAEFPVSAIIEYEPDRGAELFRLAPRVMMNFVDIEATGLVTRNSRVRYRLLLAGTINEIDTYRSWLNKVKTTGEEIHGIEQSRPELRVALGRAQQYLTLAALVAVLVCGAAIALACRHYAVRNARDSAILRCLGATQTWIVRRYLFKLFTFAIIASVTGVITGYVMQTLLVTLMQGWIDIALPLPGLQPVITGVLMGILLMLGFALPPVLRLKQVSPSRVMREDNGSVSVSIWLTLGAAFVTLGCVIVMQSADFMLALKFLLVSAVACSGLWFTASLLLEGAARTFRRGSMLYRYGLSRLLRHRGRSAMQITALCVGFTAMLVLMVARVDLLDAWQNSLPQTAPNHFMVNVQQEEIASLNRLFSLRSINNPVYYPVIKGRLVAINKRRLTEDDYESPRARRLIARNFNLTRTARLPKDNRVIDGVWHGNEAHTTAWSVEKGIAERLRIQLGDLLTFSIEGQEVSAEVTSLREVDWDSFNVNFFVIASPDLLGQFPSSYITSFYNQHYKNSIDDETGKPPLLTEIAKLFPSITVLNVEAILSQVKKVIQRAAWAVEFVFIFTLLAGILVLYAAMQAGMRERARDISVLRVIGASSRQVLIAMLTELVFIGLATGLISALATSILTWLLTTQVFDLTWTPNPWLWLWSLAGATISVCLFGLVGLRKVLMLSPVRALNLQ